MKTLTVSEGFAQLRSLADGSRVKAYVLDHEALALVLLALFLIAGTVFYVDFQPSLVAGSGPTQNSAPWQPAQAPTPKPAPQQTQQQAYAALAPATAMEAAPTAGPTAVDSASATSTDQPAALVSPNEGEQLPVHRRARHHHHRR